LEGEGWEKGKVTKIYMPTPGKDAWKFKIYLAGREGYITSWKVVRPEWLVEGQHVKVDTKKTTSTQGNVFHELTAIQQLAQDNTPGPTPQGGHQGNGRHEAEVARATAISAASRLVEGSDFAVEDRVAFVRDVSGVLVRYIQEGTWDPELDEYLTRLHTVAPASVPVAPQEEVKA
jgi:hypothetical protein